MRLLTPCAADVVVQVDKADHCRVQLEALSVHNLGIVNGSGECVMMDD